MKICIREAAHVHLLKIFLMIVSQSVDDGLENQPLNDALLDIWYDAAARQVRLSPSYVI